VKQAIEPVVVPPEPKAPTAPTAPTAVHTSKLQWEVTLPEKLQKCVPGYIVFTPTTSVSEEVLENSRKQLFVELECSAEADVNDIESDAITVSFEKTLYTYVDLEENKYEFELYCNCCKWDL
jgi:hypothetical protein